MSEPKTEVIRIKDGEATKIKAYSWNTPGSHDYKSQGFEIERIIDRDGVEHTPRWEDDPIQLFPGCTTSREGGYRYLHVSSSACPMRVLHCHWFRYTGSEAAHNSSWESRTWYQFEAEEGE